MQVLYQAYCHRGWTAVTPDYPKVSIRRHSGSHAHQEARSLNGWVAG